jgi:hypothetical protein
MARGLLALLDESDDLTGQRCEPFAVDTIVFKFESCQIQRESRLSRCEH